MCLKSTVKAQGKKRYNISFTKKLKIYSGLDVCDGCAIILGIRTSQFIIVLRIILELRSGESTEFLRSWNLESKVLNCSKTIILFKLASMVIGKE